MHHHPVGLTRPESNVLGDVEIYSAAREECKTVPRRGRRSTGKRGRSAGMIATDQGVHKRRVFLVGAERKHRAERVSVVVEAHPALARISCAEVGSDPEGVAEVSVKREVKAVRAAGT